MARTLIIVGDGVGGGTEDVTLNLSHTGALIRHEQEVTHNLEVNSDGILTFDAAVEFSSELSASNRPRFGTFTVNGGAVDVAGPLNRLTVAATGDALAVNNFVDFTAVGGTFTADFGGDLADLSAVQAAASLGGDGSFRSSAGLALSVMDNGDSSFTVEALSDLAVLTLQVDPNTGNTWIRNTTGNSIDINSYQITSAGGALDPLAWNSFSDQNLDPVDGGDDPGETWDEVGTGTANSLHEGFLLGSSSVPAGGLSLGAAFDESVFGAGNDGDLEFTYRTDAGALIPGVVVYDALAAVPGDYNENGVVDAADYAVWRDNLGGTSLPNEGGISPGVVDQADYDFWVSRFGATSGSGSLASAAVPEPTSVALLLAAVGGVALLRTRRSNGVDTMKDKPSKLSRGWLGLATCFVVAWAVVGSTAQAAVYNDRVYSLGDDSLENASANTVVGSGSPFDGDTLDSGDPNTPDSSGTDPTGSFLDLEQTGNPMYVDVSTVGSGRTGLGVQFDGTDDHLSGEPLDRPDSLADRLLPTVYPIGYSGITSRGVQMWAYVDSTKLALDEPQTLLLDSQIFGGPQITADGKWSQFNSQHSVDGTPFGGGPPAEVDVVADTWLHVMHHVYNPDDPNAPQRVTGGAGTNHVAVVYVNGVAVSSNVDNLPAGFDLTSGGFSGSLIIGAEDDGSGGFENHFQGVLDDIKMYVFGDNEAGTPGDLSDGEDWGEFDLFADNEWIANEIATTVPGGVLEPGDVTKDGNIDGADVNAFIAGWLSRNVQTGAHGTQAVGDWLTWDNGDMNHDGVTDLGDLFIMNQALAGVGAGQITAAMLNGSAVPEPSSIALVTLAGVAGLLRWRRQHFAR